MTPLTTVTINNANPNLAHMVENATSKIQTVAADEANTVITSRGVTVTIPAGALPADDHLMITVRLAWLVLPAPVLGLVLFSGRRCRSPQLLMSLVLLGLCCSLTLTGCGGNDGGDAGNKQEASLTVGLAANGVAGQGAMSGPVSAAAVAVAGPRITVSQ